MLVLIGYLQEEFCVAIPTLPYNSNSIIIHMKDRRKDKGRAEGRDNQRDSEGREGIKGRKEEGKKEKRERGKKGGREEGKTGRYRPALPVNG
jgi:hypothetical protein